MNRLTITPLTRVEGLGEIHLQLSGEQLVGVELRITEAPRLFESLLCGRRIDEVPALVSRICAICATPHALAAILALEQAIGLTPPPAARLVRELALLGDLIQSHALHLFALVLPDLRGSGSLLELLRAADPVATDGMALKQFGNRIQQLAGGRLIHPVTFQLGGVLRRPDSSALAEIASGCDQWLGKLQRWQDLFATVPTPRDYAPACGIPLTVEGDTPLPLWGTTLQGGDKDLPVSAYREWLQEQSLETSSARRITGAHGSWRTGALARQQAKVSPLTTTHGIFANNAAQLHEMAIALARIAELVSELRRLGQQPLLQVTPQWQSGIGTIALEAPRGTLIHQYGIDDGGRIASADIITPTTINQAVIEEQLYADLARGCPHEQLKLRAEQIVRAFDPCISCAVHLIRM